MLRPDFISSTALSLFNYFRCDGFVAVQASIVHDKILRFYNIFVPATKSKPGVNYVTLYLWRLPTCVGFLVNSLLITKSFIRYRAWNETSTILERQDAIKSDVL